MLVFDDLHWTDAASLELLRIVVRGLDSLPALIVATYRVEEMTERHFLHQHLPAIIHETNAVRLGLQRLDEAGIRALIERFRLSGRDKRRFVTYLDERADGNPFFINELLHTLEEGGVLRSEGEAWVLGDPRTVRVPPLVRQVISGRVARLEPETQRLLTIGAVIGQEIPLTLWATIADEDEESLLAAIERAIIAHLLEEGTDAMQVRFVHALIRETLYEGSPIGQRRLWHRRIGEVLAVRAAPDPDAVAHHFRRAGDERAVTWLVTVGDRAKRAHAWLTAADRFETALMLLEESGADAEERGWLLIRLADARRYSERGRGIQHLEEAAHWAEATDDHALAAYALRNRGWFHCLSGNTGVGLRDLEAGLAAQDALNPADWERLRDRREAIRHQIGTDRDQVPRVLWNVAAGRYVVALAAANHIYMHETKADSADLYFAVAQLHAMLGRPSEAQRRFAQAHDAYTTQHYFGVGQCALYELDWRILPYDTDRLVEREQIAATGEEYRMRASGMMKSDESSRFVRLPLLILEGQWGEARQLMMGVRTAGRNINYLPATTALCALAREQGDGALAWMLVREILPAGIATEPGDIWFMDAVRLQRMAASLAIDEGDLPTARAWLEAHDRWMDWNGEVLGQAEAALLWERYYRATDTPSLAYEHAVRAFAHANEPRQPLALLAAHRLLGELDTEAGRHSDAAMHLDGSLALADACAAPYERALTLLALAALHRAMLNIPAAQHALDEARAICTPLGAKPALARADALAMQLAAIVIPRPIYPNGLTAREVEVLRLIAQGRSNQEIAEALSMSARTAERHISNIYGKIGAHGRAEATAYAFQHDLT